MPILLALLFSALSPSTSLAQLSLFSSLKEKEVTIDRAEFGFSGTVPPEAWTPITVWITGGPRGFSGAMVVEFNQDDTQPARIIVPAAATPGVSVPVEAIACIPAGLDSLTITMVDQAGRPQAEVTFSRMPEPHERQLIADTIDDQWRVLCVGRTSAVRAFPSPKYISYRRTEDGVYLANSPTRRPPDELVFALLDGSRLPLSWAAYSGVQAVVIDAQLSPAPDPRAVEALKTWVDGGGRLFLLANSPGNLWRRWFPPGPEGDLVEIDEVSRHAIAGELADSVRLTGRLRRPSGAVFAIDAARREIRDGSAPEVLPADSVSGRLIRPTRHAIAQGWTTRWASPETPGVGLLAEGPVGFGWVTVLGVEPELTAAVATKDATAAVWGDAIRVALSDWLERTARDPARVDADHYSPGWDWQSSRSAPDRDSRAALTAALNAVSTVPPVGRGVFWAIAACLALLALMVGPFDALVLKRLKLRHFSWLTALGWIALASVGAYVVPGVIRSGRTTFNRAQFVDVLCPAGAGARPRAWQTGVTGIFASRRGELQLENASAASWWRGVSSRPWNPWERVRTTPFSALTTVQSGAEGARGNVPERLWQAQWTFRTFQDDGPLDSPLRAKFAAVGDAYEVRVDGLPPGAKFVRGAIRIVDRWYLIAPKVAESADQWALGAVNGRFVLTSTAAADPQSWDRPTGARQSGLGLPGPRRRTATIDARLKSGEFAAVYLHTTGGPASPGLNIAADYGTQTIARIFLPLPESSRPGAPETPEEGTTP